MAGNICMGNDRVPNDISLSRAYCKGREDRVHGVGAAEDYKNPHTVLDSAAHNAYNRGFLSAGINPESVHARDCCAPHPLGQGWKGLPSFSRTPPTHCHPRIRWILPSGP